MGLQILNSNQFLGDTEVTVELVHMILGIVRP